MSLALYSKNGRMFVFEVSYEFPESMFVGFRKKDEKYNGNFYEIKPNEGFYKVYRIDLPDSSRWNVPIGKKYTQLPGGGGGYKVTRQYDNVLKMLQSSTVIKILNNFFLKAEAFFVVRNLIRETIDNLIFTRKINKPEVTTFRMFEDKIKLKQEKPSVGFTAVSIEDESEKKKISDIFDLLKEQGKIPADSTRPSFKDGALDYHMTIKFGELPLSHRTDLDKEVILNVETIGISNNAVALGVSGNYFSNNDFQHITLAFIGFPEYSKDIKDWTPLEHPFKIKGVIREFTSRKELIKRGVFDEANQIQIGNFPDQMVPAGKSAIFPKAEKN